MMLEKLKQRLLSKTYWAAVIGALLTIAEVQGGYITSFLPTGQGKYLLMLWPVVMLILREVTTTALSGK